jgi:hypothetical protein
MSRNSKRVDTGRDYNDDPESEGQSESSEPLYREAPHGSTVKVPFRWRNDTTPPMKLLYTFLGLLMAISLFLLVTTSVLLSQRRHSSCIPVQEVPNTWAQEQAKDKHLPAKIASLGMSLSSYRAATGC